jgi:hypothetical protein
MDVLGDPAHRADKSGRDQYLRNTAMFKFEPNQTKEQIFQAVFWNLLVERRQEVADYELTELAKQIDWALAISMALLSALILKGGDQTAGVPVSEKLFLGALLASIVFRIAAKLWTPKYLLSKPTDTPVRRLLTEMTSASLQDGFFKEMDFRERRFASFNVSVTLSQALKPEGEKVPKKVLEGEDASVLKLKAFVGLVEWKKRLHWAQLGFTFLAILGFSGWLLFG